MTGPGERSNVTGRRAFAGAAAALVAALVLAGPAAANAPSMYFDGPSPASPLDDANVEVTASLSHTGGFSGNITLKVARDGAPSGETITATQAGTASTTSVRFPVQLAYNGRYTATLTATGAATGLHATLTGGSEGQATTTFAVRAAPANPTEVKTAVDTDSRVVTVTWKKNAELDLKGYLIRRARGSGAYSELGRATVASPRFVDATTAEAGGDYHYQVFAVRAGLDADDGVSSDPSASTVRVPDPPPPPTTATTAPAGGSSGAGGATTGSSIPAGSPGALTTSGSVDLSGFANLQTEAKRAVVPRVIEPPDPGFLNTLPFGEDDQAAEPVVPPGEVGEAAVAGTDQRELGADEGGESNNRSLVFLAAGLLATVLLMHVQWLKGEVDKVPLEALPPEGAAPVVGAVAASTGRARRGRSGGRFSLLKPSRP